MDALNVTTPLNEAALPASPSNVSTTEAGAGLAPASASRGNSRWSAANAALGFALFALLAVISLTIAIETALLFWGGAMDGPFQLYNPLRRIETGLRPGIDFQVFHGLGIPYLHYPFYRLFGRGLEGSELARQLVSAVAFPIALVTVFRAFTGDWRRTWYLASAA